MADITLTEEKLSDLMNKIAHKAAEDTISHLINDKGALSKFIESIEDYGLGKLMEDGRTGEFVDTEDFLKKLDRKIAG